MAFSFPLPDPDSSAIVDTYTPEGEVEPGLAPEVDSAVQAVIAAQGEGLMAVMQSIAGAIQAQLAAQVGALTAAQNQIGSAITTQIAGQRAALESALLAVRNWTGNQLAQQGENVGTVAIHAAMRPPPTGPIPPLHPQPPGGQPQPGVWPLDRPKPPQPVIPPGVFVPANMQQTSTVPGAVPSQSPGMQQTGTMPFTPGAPQSGTIPVSPNEQGTRPFDPAQQGASTVPYTPPDPTQTRTGTIPQPDPSGTSTLPLTPTMPGWPWSQTSTTPFDPTDPTQAQTSTQPFQPFDPDLPVPGQPIYVDPQTGQPSFPGTPGQPGTPGTPTGPGTPGTPGTPQQPPGTTVTTQVSPPAASDQDDQDGTPDVYVNVNVTVNEGDSSATATASAMADGKPSVINVTNVTDSHDTTTTTTDDHRSIFVADENDERNGGRRQINVEAEDEERRLRRIFAQAAPQAGDQQFTPSECPWRIGMVIPPIGGPEWCRLRGAILLAVSAAGNAVWEFISKYIEGLADMAIDVLSHTRAWLRPTTGDLIATWFQELIRPPAVALDRLRGMKRCFEQSTKIVPTCAPGTMLGLAVFRCVIKSMKHIMLGTDAGVWLTGTMTVELPQLERMVDALMESVCPTVLPTPAEAWHAYISGHIDEAAWRCWTLMAGADPDIWKPVQEAKGLTVSAEHVIFAGRMIDANPEQIAEALYARGWTRNADRNELIRQYDKRPDMLTMIHAEWAHVTDGDTNLLFGREEGFDDWWKGPLGKLAWAGGMTEEVAKRTWIAAARIPPLDDVRQLAWRARVFDDDGVERANKVFVASAALAMGMSKATATHYAAMIYRPLNAQEMSLLVRMELANQGETHQIMMDSGLISEDADRTAKALEWDAHRLRVVQEQGWSIAAVMAASQIGYTLPPGAQRDVDKQGFDQHVIRVAKLVAAVQMRAGLKRKGRQQASSKAIAAVLSAYGVGIVTAPNAAAQMVSAGYDLPSAKLILQAQDLHTKAAHTGKILRSLERAVLRGEMTALAAGVVMAQMNLVPSAIDGYMAEWRIDLLARRPTSTVRDVRRWVSEGLMTLAQAKLRLANLGWKDPDLTLQTAEMGGKLAEAQAKAKLRGAAAAAQAAKDAERVRQKALRALEKSRPVGALAQWYKDGVLTRAQIFKRMRLYGYDDNTIGLYVAGWDHQKAKKLASATSPKPAAQKAPERQVPLGTLRRWYIDDIVDKEFVRGRLTDYGYDHPTRERYLVEWDAKRADQDERRRKKSEDQPGG